MAHQFGNLTVKLMRTFTMQAEGLANLQLGGVQPLKHIHVDNRAGRPSLPIQSIVGGQNARTDSQPNKPSAALPCQNAAGIVAPMPGYKGQDALPDSRVLSSGATKGNRNALKHGRNTNEPKAKAWQMRQLIASSREVLALL